MSKHKVKPLSMGERTAELHAAYGVQVPGTGAQRAISFTGSWANRRGLDPLRPWTIPSVQRPATAAAAAPSFDR